VVSEENSPTFPLWYPFSAVHLVEEVPLRGGFLGEQEAPPSVASLIRWFRVPFLENRIQRCFSLKVGKSPSELSRL